MSRTVDNVDRRAVARVFSSAAFRSLSLPLLPEVVRSRLGVLGELVPDRGVRLSDAFQIGYRSLLKYYRNEYTFKNEIVSKVVFGRHSPSTATAVLEQPMGSSEADLLVLNGTSTVYEIKTDYDNLDRLQRQVEDYGRHAEFVNVVVTEARATATERVLPPTVGLIAWRRSGSFSVLREPTSSLWRLQHDDLFGLLRTSEALEIVRSLRQYEVDVPRGHLRKELLQEFRALDVRVAHHSMVATLRRRGKSARQLTLQPDFPPSLRAAAYGTGLSGVAIERLRERLSAPFATISG